MQLFVFLVALALVLPSSAVLPKRHSVNIQLVEKEPATKSCYYNIFLTNFVKTGFGGAVVSAALDGETLPAFAGFTLPDALDESGWQLPVTPGANITLHYTTDDTSYTGNVVMVTDVNGNKLVEMAMDGLSFHTFDLGSANCECIYLTEDECPEIRVRNDWRSHTWCEKKNFIDALNTYRRVADKDDKNMYEKFIMHHAGISATVIEMSLFLPWHRAFILKLENQLRSLGGRFSCVTLPFWDTGLDSGAEEKSQLFVDLGGLSPSSCMGSPFEWWRNPLNRDNGTGCVTRWATVGSLWEQFPTATALDLSIVANRAYSYIFRYLVRNPHKSVHIFVSGAMASLSSPADPLFFLHHCNLDRLYATWQDCWDYDTDRFTPDEQFSIIASTQTHGTYISNYTMPPIFPDNHDPDNHPTVLDMLNITKLGYTYTPVTRTMMRLNQSSAITRFETCNWDWFSKEAQDSMGLAYRLPVHNDEQRIRLSVSRRAYHTFLATHPTDFYHAMEAQLNSECLLTGGYNASDFPDAFMAQADQDIAIGPGDMFKNACKLLKEGTLDQLVQYCTPDYSC